MGMPAGLAVPRAQVHLRNMDLALAKFPVAIAPSAATQIRRTPGEAWRTKGLN
jgi:hypothetical protein